MNLITNTVSRTKSPHPGRFSARSAMPAGTAQEIRQSLSQWTFERLLTGLRARKLMREAEG